MDAKQTFAGKVANDVKFGGLEKCAPLFEVCHLVARCLGSQDGECRLARHGESCEFYIQTRCGVAFNPTLARTVGLTAGGQS